jgi:uncharacterized protein YoxC
MMIYSLRALDSPVQATTMDTVAVLVPSGPLATAEAVSTIVLAVGMVCVLIALFAVLLQIRRLSQSLGSVAKRWEKEAAPVMDRARSVAENVEFITMSVRTDVQKLNASVASLNDRLKQASDRMEERIQDFNALVEVMQSEAEGLALDTAAAVRGLRAGTGSLAGAAEDLPHATTEVAPFPGHRLDPGVTPGAPGPTRAPHSEEEG